jgi:MYXO-CTERM domain-containing protein
MRLSSGLLFAALATTLTLASSPAFATTSGETGAETSGDSGGGDSSSAWFVSPLPNAFYETAPVSIDVEIDVYQGLDDSITDIELFLDGTSVASLPCAEGCIFADVVLEQGVHELAFTAAPNGYASSLTVYVDAEIPSGTETGGESEGESGADSESGLGGADEADAGNDLEAKGCNAQGGNAAPWMLALPILVLAVRLRRERG